MSRQLPSNLDAERALLGAILSNNRAFDLCPGLEPWHFADATNSEIFSGIKRAISAGRVADAVTLRSDFENAGLLEQVGGVSYLVALLSAMVSIIQAPDYAHAIIDCALRRQIIAIAEDGSERAYRSNIEDGDGADTVAKIMGDLEEAMASTAVSASVRLGAAAKEAVGRADAAQRGDKGSGGFLTGLQPLDDRWGGLYPGSLEIVGARPGTGKTAFASQVARMLAGRGHPVGFFSLEVPASDLATANLASEAQVDVADIRSGNFTSAQAHALILAQRRLDALPITVIDNADLTLSNLISQMRALARTGNRIFIIDHRNKVERDAGCERMTKLDWYSHVTDRLKKAAKRLRVSIILLVQCRRDTEQRDDQRPRMSDLEYSGEQDADNIALLHRPELNTNDPPRQGNLSGERHANQLREWYAERAKTAGICEVIFAKRRFGIPGTTTLKFHGPTLTFHELPTDENSEIPPDLWYR